MDYGTGQAPILKPETKNSWEVSDQIENTKGQERVVHPPGPRADLGELQSAGSHISQTSHLALLSAQDFDEG